MMSRKRRNRRPNTRKINGQQSDWQMNLGTQEKRDTSLKRRGDQQESKKDGRKSCCHKNRAKKEESDQKEINLCAEWVMQTALGRSDSEDSKAKGSGTGSS